MTRTTKTFWDVHINPHNPLQKVNFRQYLTNDTEPEDIISGASRMALNEQSGIIAETYFRKRILRKFALRLRTK